MGKTLVLRARVPGDDGKATWHDAFILRNALEEMAKGKILEKMAVFLAMSRKLFLARDEAGLEVEDLDVEIEVELRNSEARLLWKGIRGLTPEQYGRDQLGRPAVVPLGPLGIMLEDFAEQLGEKVPEPDED